MKEEIKSIILEYCEGISFLEFDADKLDEIAERIEGLSKLPQPTIIKNEVAACNYKYHNRDITTNGECTNCESPKWR